VHPSWGRRFTAWKFGHRFVHEPDRDSCVQADRQISLNRLSKFKKKDRPHRKASFLNFKQFGPQRDQARRSSDHRRSSEFHIVHTVRTSTRLSPRVFARHHRRLDLAGTALLSSWNCDRNRRIIVTHSTESSGSGKNSWRKLLFECKNERLRLGSLTMEGLNREDLERYDASNDNKRTNFCISWPECDCGSGCCGFHNTS
jgi:hypothetical protein